MLTSAPRSGGLSAASVAEATRSRSPGVSSVAFRAQSPNLRFAPLMDMDFAVRCQLVRHWRLIFDFCSSTRTFDRCFLQTPPRGGSPCIISRPSPPSGWPEDFHLQTAEHAQHTTKPRSGNGPAQPLPNLPIAAVAWNEAPEQHWIWVYRQIDQSRSTKRASQ